ncbi:glycoside hydrolase family 3 protein [Heterobasidion irregulare TC 32-1]|uniref:beta-glucosidase n=1 Tax=Heterobasidion irregulare (strain TC 32-1) TaxID=747525 RepID=W4KCW1_HETIT|nr:glycoside hydrolase family 3 protein [Heterobasidion irregulare TC 32-1]ETW83697.1 glycoside hydrolase family 3 protein [Heterobasidion irregulare TC 32-1]
MANATFDVEGTLAKLTLPQKIKMLAGLGWWHTEPVPEAGVPSMRMSDGPNGVRGTRFFNGVPSSCFPSSTGLGSSFDLDLAKEVGEALGDECRAKSSHILLAPTVNTQRSPLGGRGFESFSEDPHLNGTIAAAYINGLQSKGVAATIKHFVANDQEFESERALREIYLKPFQIAIKKANPWALMTAYNRVNGLHVSENPWLIDEILRKEWGFKGMIMSDWTGVYSTAESIKAGVELEMPGPTVMRGKAVERALVGGKLFPSDIDDRVRKILELLKRAHASGIPFDGPEDGVDTPQLRSLLRRAAASAIVLLKNDRSLLPLSGSIKSIAVIGPNAKQAFTSGGGSARLLETYSVSPLEGIRVAAKELGAEVRYTVGATSHKYLPVLDGYMKYEGGNGALVEFWNYEPLDGWVNQLKDGEKCVWSTPTRGSNCFLIDGIYSASFIPDESGDYEFGLTITGNGNLFVNSERVIDLATDPPAGDAFFGLGTADLRAVVKGLKAGEPVPIEVRLSNASFIGRGSPFTCRGGIRLGAVRIVAGDEAIQEAVKMAKESDVAILVVGMNHELESEGFDRPDMKLPGLTDRLVTEVLKANPNTVVVNQSGTPVEMPWIDEAHTLLQAFYGGNELGNGLSDMLFGKVNPSGKLALTFPKRLEDSPPYPSFGDKGESSGKILYNEGIYVGYRSYDKLSVEPLFPFGFGLSYTTFSYNDLETTSVSADGTFSVSFTITNTGNFDGSESAQVYISDPASALPRPVKELKGFTKVTLKAGESTKASVVLDREALGYFDERRKAWVAEKGVFEVLVGASSRDIRLKSEVELKETFTWTGL